MCLDLSDLIVSVANQVRLKQTPKTGFSGRGSFYCIVYHPGVYHLQTDLNKQFDLSLLFHVNEVFIGKLKLVC